MINIKYMLLLFKYLGVLDRGFLNMRILVPRNIKSDYPPDKR
jgi:hypothetical protein